MCMTKINEMCMTKMKKMYNQNEKNVYRGGFLGVLNGAQHPQYFGEIVVQALKWNYNLYY